MSTNEKIKISVPSASVRVAWSDLPSLPYSPEEIMEIVQRYCDQADLRKDYMKRRNLKTKLLKARLEQLAKSAGMTIEAYLELEEANASSGE